MKPISEVLFPPVRLRRGYDMLEVDQFLDRVSRSHKEEWPRLVKEARFSTVFMREGYEMKSVDDYLAELAAEGGPTRERKTVDPDAGFREDARKLQEDWGAVWPGGWTSTVSSKPFEAPPEELLVSMEKKANDALAAVIVGPKEQELATMLLQMVKFYRDMQDAIQGFDNISLKTSPLKDTTK